MSADSLTIWACRRPSHRRWQSGSTGAGRVAGFGVFFISDIPNTWLRKISILTCLNRLRPCSFLPDWWVGTIPDRIDSLIYIKFD
jgi:hypothetical protein